MDLCGQIVSCHAMPVFHAISLIQITLVVSAIPSSVFPFRQFSGVCRIGDGSLQASLPSCAAKPPERVRGDDRDEVLDRSSCSSIHRGNVVITCLFGFSFKVISRFGLVTRLP